jgi:2-polyprenyl-3-methyl-5-hydroxy-6-metoxy-1,4-benzoquinol methylase
MRNISFLKSKPIQYYKGIRIKADTFLHDQLANIICSFLPKGSNILDYGAGEGAFSQRIHDLGYRVFAVDIEQESFKASVPFERLDFNNNSQIISFQQKYLESFDLVLGIEVIEHVENPWQFIRNLKSLVKPGGWILISTPNVTSWYSRINFFLKGRFHQFEDYDRHYGHINPVTEDELRLICEQSGLQVKQILPGGWLPRLWLSCSPKVLLINLLGFWGSFFMKGLYEGWCLIALIKKPGD